MSTVSAVNLDKAICMLMHFVNCRTLYCFDRLNLKTCSDKTKADLRIVQEWQTSQREHLIKRDQKLHNMCFHLFDVEMSQ